MVVGLAVADWAVAVSSDNGGEEAVACCGSS